jgi:transglutaminase/protease-like cytokinesis protein 3
MFGNLKFDEDLSNWLKLIETLQSKTNIKDYILSRKRESFDNLDELKTFLLKSPAKTEVEKAWAVYLWMTHNIDYDFTGYITKHFRSEQPEPVFKSGLCTCTGYANLSQILFDAFNIKSVNIRGYCKGYGYRTGDKFKDTNHSYNAVFIENKWQFYESCWVK